MITALRDFVFRNFIYRSFIYSRYGGYGGGPIGPGTPPLPPESVQSFWIGHVTSGDATITVKILNPAESSYTINWSTSPFFSSFSSATQSIDQYGLIKYNITNLVPNTRYYLRVTKNNRVGLSQPGSSFRTASVGPHSFEFGFGSCSRSCPPNCDNSNTFGTASNSILYNKLADRAANNELEFFIHLGDIHYRDIAVNIEQLYHTAFDDVFKTARQTSCWAQLPMYYMWDDHDYGPNDTDKNSPSRMAAISAFRTRVPSPSLAQPSGSPYYTFKRGRVKFIVTDIRSEREPKGAYPSTDSQQQVFSAAQKSWFFSELISAKNQNLAIIWVNTKPWVSSIENGKDDWGGYHAARMEIVDYITNNNIADRMVIISGDMHALAYDDGTSTNNYGGLKVCHAAPLDQEPRGKGGPYTIGPIMNDGGTGWASQYGIIDVTDTGTTSINMRFRGISVNTSTGAETTSIDVNFNLNIGAVLTADPPSSSTTLNTIANYLRQYMNDLRNPDFYYYTLDGSSTFISDGGGDMFDGGNYTMPWFLNNTYYGPNWWVAPAYIDYSNTSPTTIDTNFNYISLGYGSNPERRPLTVLGSRSIPNSFVGFQKGGNLGADGGGSILTSTLYAGSIVNGFTVHACYRLVFAQNDPAVCDLYMLLGHPNWESSFGSVQVGSLNFDSNSQAYFLYSTNATNVLAIATLLSRPCCSSISQTDIQAVVNRYTLRIREALGW